MNEFMNLEVPRKSLIDLSWQVPEETYRANPAISYSTLSTYARGGHKVIPNLFDKKESAALRFGGLVDTLLTEPESIDDKYFFADFPNITDTIQKIVRTAYELFGEQHRSLDSIPFDSMLNIVNFHEYYTNWKPETRVKDVIKKGGEYYQLLFLAGDKPVISSEEKERAELCVSTLRTHPYTKDMFEMNPFEEDIEKHFQLKFLLEESESPLLKGLGDIRCMFDLIIVDHKNKVIKPCDLKTTGKDESSFEESFLTWRYDIQATMYSYILQTIVSKDDYYKNFKIDPFSFIVINKVNLTPLIWVYKDNLTIKNKVDKLTKMEYKSWLELLTELKWYLDSQKYEYPREAYENNGILTIENLV